MPGKSTLEEEVVDVAPQRRSWLARVGVVTVTAMAALVGVSAPAFAADSRDRRIHPESRWLRGSARLQLQDQAIGGAGTFQRHVDTTSPDIIATCAQGCDANQP
jgi:hypothetical protein